MDSVPPQRETRVQRPDEKKRDAIAAAAARLFATRPFHKVRLDDIAAAARIGKGTLYVYFDNKEDLYFSLIYDGFAALVDRLKEQVRGAAMPAAKASAAEGLRRIVGELVAFAFQHPYFYELTRAVGTAPLARAGKARGRGIGRDWDGKRQELQDLIERTIRRGVRAGELDDPFPELTAGCIPGMVRSVMLFGPKEAGQAEVTANLVRLLERGIGRQRGRR